MTHLSTLKMSLVAAALLALPMSQASAMSRAEYDAALQKCGPMVGDDKTLCTENARQRWSIEGSAADKNVVRERAPGYDTDMKKCEPLVGDDRTLCTEAAKLKWPLAVNPNPPAPTAAALKRAADLKAALSKCEPLVGDDRTLCTEAARLKFGTT